MASFTDAQLEALRKQCVQAEARGYQIANINPTLNSLAEETGVKDAPEGVKKGSVSHLLALVLEAKAQLAGKPKPTAPKSASKPELVKPAPKVEPKPEPKPEPVVEVTPEPVVEVAAEPEPSPVVEVAPEPEKPEDAPVAPASTVGPEKKSKKRR
jgi:hypothetical protein